jgi:antitoxin component YwqK of YwqJK toxin-antitoxin module
MPKMLINLQKLVIKLNIKMKIKQALISVIFLFVHFTSFGQDFNQTNENGQKTGPWRGFYDKTKNLKYEGTFENGYEVGKFVFYEDEKGKKIKATKVFEQQGTVCYTTLFNRKFKLSEGSEVNRLKEGKWIYYFENSNIKISEENYLQGKLHGKKIVFYKDGNMAEESFYENGLKHGVYKKYGLDQKLLEEKTYVNDEIEGKIYIYDYDGKVSVEGQYRKDRAYGIWKYFENGKLVKEENKSEVKKIKRVPIKAN